MVKPKGLSKKSKAPQAVARPKAAPPAPPEGDTERRILEAARKEFIAKGLEGARMQSIAAEAGVNKALLHYYYRSKDRLYRTVVSDILRNVWGKISAHFLSHGPGDDLESMMRTLVSTYIRTLAANPDFPLFMIREISSGGAVFKSVLMEADLPVGEVPKRMATGLQAAIKAGQVKPIQPMHFFMNVMGMSVASFLARPALEKLAPALGLKIRFDEAFFEERIRCIVDMAMNGIRTRREP